MKAEEKKAEAKPMATKSDDMKADKKAVAKKTKKDKKAKKAKEMKEEKKV